MYAMLACVLSRRAADAYEGVLLFPHNVSQGMQVGTFLNCDESVPKIAQLLGSMVDDAVVQCGRKRVPRLEWPPAFAVRTPTRRSTVQY